MLPARLPKPKRASRPIRDTSGSGLSHLIEQFLETQAPGRIDTGSGPGPDSGGEFAPAHRPAFLVVDVRRVVDEFLAAAEQLDAGPGAGRLTLPGSDAWLTAPFSCSQVSPTQRRGSPVPRAEVIGATALSSRSSRWGPRPSRAPCSSRQPVANSPPRKAPWR